MSTISSSKKTNNIRCNLFGGALLFAGLQGPAIAAPNFEWGDTAGVFAYAAYGQPSTDTFAGVGDGSVLAYRDTGGYGYGTPVRDTLAYAAWDANRHEARTIANAYRFATLDQTGPGYGTTDVTILQPFTVTEDAFVDISWNFEDTTDALLQIVDESTQQVLFEAFEGSSGLSTIQISANTQTSLRYIQIANGFSGAQESAHEIVLRAIPAPATAALAGLAGVVAVRRRRS